MARTMPISPPQFKPVSACPTSGADQAGTFRIQNLLAWPRGWSIPKSPYSVCPMELPSFPAEIASTAIAICLFALVAGLARGFSGFGGALIFVPLASALVGPLIAVPVLLLADLVSFAPRLAGNLKGCSWPQLRRILAGAVVGFPLGAQVLTGSDPTTIRWVASLLILACLVVLASGWRYRGPELPAISAGVGLVSGVMSGLAQIGGPPVVVYWLGTDPNRRPRPRQSPDLLLRADGDRAGDLPVEGPDRSAGAVAGPRRDACLCAWHAGRHADVPTRLRAHVPPHRLCPDRHRRLLGHAGAGRGVAWAMRTAARGSHVTQMGTQMAKSWPNRA